MKVEDSTLAVVRALERLGVRHSVTGSLASALHGEPRATNDADVVADLRPAQFERLKAELGGRFFLDEDDFVHATTSERSFTSWRRPWTPRLADADAHLRWGVQDSER